MPRMKILNSLEREAFESPPHFNSAERKRFFSLPPALNGIVEGLRTPSNKVCFIVTAGYFQARRKFFAKQFRPPDVEFVARQLGVEARDVYLSVYNKQGGPHGACGMRGSAAPIPRITLALHPGYAG